MLTIRASLLPPSMMMLAVVVSAAPRSIAEPPRAASSTPAATKPPEAKPRRSVDESTAPLRGVVRGPAGKLASKATVWLAVRRDDGFDPPLKTQTDEQGRFSFAESDRAKPLRSGGRTAVVARDAQGRLGWHNFDRPSGEEPLCEIKLHETTLLTGRVLDLEDRAVPQAQLSVQWFSELRADGAPHTRDDELALWPELAAEYSTASRKDGVFEIIGVPRGVTARCNLIACEDHLVVTIESGIAATVRLGKVGGIAGRLALPDGADLPIKGFQLEAWSQRGAEQPGTPVTQTVRSISVDAEGRFSFAGLTPGRYVIRSANGQNVPFFVDPTAPLEVKPGQVLDDVALSVIRCREVRGRVADRETGRGIESVEITIFSGEYGKWRNAHAVHTDAEGRFLAWLAPGDLGAIVRHVPVEFLLPAFGAYQQGLDESPLIQLQQATSIEGVVVDEQGNAVPSALLNIKSTRSRAGQLDPPERADASGRFVVRQLDPSESLIVRARTATAASPTPLTIVPSQFDGTARIVVSQQTACWIRGRVVDRRGNPLPQARVAINASRQIEVEREPPAFVGGGRGYREMTWLVAVPQLAADGSFETEALYAGDTYQLQVTAPGHGDRLCEPVRGEAGETHVFGRLVLDEFVAFTGTVVDAAGKPVPNAELHVAMPLGSPQPDGVMIALRGDDTGRFTLPPANLKGVLRIWVRAGQLASHGPISFLPDFVDGPLKIELDQRPGVSVVGEVVDMVGNPIRASVAIVWQLERPESARGRSPLLGFGRPMRTPAKSADRISLGQVAANVEGRFSLEGLWPGERYHFNVTAAGYETLDSPAFTREAGMTLDAGRLVLRRNDLSVEGAVLGSDGKPVARASVYNSGDSHEPLVAETGGDGRFRLSGLLEGPVCLLIRKPGHWPAGLRCAAGDVDQQVRLIEDAQPRRETPLAPADQKPAAGNRELALRLLTELWERREVYERNTSSQRSTSRRREKPPRGGDVVRHAASIDFRQALRWSAVEGGAFDEIVRVYAFDDLVHDDVNLAIAHADSPGAGNRLKWMAQKRLAAGARDDAARLLEAALHGDLQTGYSYSNPHDDIVSQAQVGALAIAAGRDEWGRGLVNEAADRVEHLAGAADAQTRAIVAAALASYDSPRSVRIWEMPPPTSGVSANYPGELAILVGLHDLEAARRIAGTTQQGGVGRGIGRTASFGGSNAVDFDGILVQIARRLAAAHPEKALLMLNDVGDNQQLNKADALGRIALALAPRSPKAAHKLIDRAFDLCLAEPRPRQGITSGGENSMASAARIALMAAEAGYPDMQTAIDRVLALRPAPAQTPSAAARSVLTIEAAWVLAFFDPQTARSLLSGVTPPDVAVASYSDGRVLTDWLQAWVLLDRDRATQLFHQVLAAQGDGLTPECVNSLLSAIGALVWSRDDRVSHVLDGSIPTYFPYVDAVGRLPVR